LARPSQADVDQALRHLGDGAFRGVGVAGDDDARELSVDHRDGEVVGSSVPFERTARRGGSPGGWGS
jgi:hypothetical protein